MLFKSEVGPKDQLGRRRNEQSHRKAVTCDTATRAYKDENKKVREEISEKWKDDCTCALSILPTPRI